RPISTFYLIVSHASARCVKVAFTTCSYSDTIRFTSRKRLTDALASPAKRLYHATSRHSPTNAPPTDSGRAGSQRMPFTPSMTISRKPPRLLYTEYRRAPHTLLFQCLRLLPLVPVNYSFRLLSPFLLWYA